MNLDRSAWALRGQKESSSSVTGRITLDWCVSHVCRLSIPRLDIEVNNPQRPAVPPTLAISGTWRGMSDSDEGLHPPPALSLPTHLPCGVNGLRAELPLRRGSGLWTKESFSHQPSTKASNIVVALQTAWMSVCDSQFVTLALTPLYCFCPQTKQNKAKQSKTCALLWNITTSN